MTKYPLIDVEHGVPERRLDKMYLTTAKIAVKYGKRPHTKPYSRDKIIEFWEEDPDIPRPTRSAFQNNMRVPTIKWFIHNRLTIDDDIWNADFLHGMARNGKISWNKISYPTLYLYNNDSLRELIELSPFGGKIRANIKWNFVPALYLKYSEKTVSFLAGVLAGGKIVKKNGCQFVSYTYRLHRLLIEWGIPIEHVRHKQILVSPIWVALMTLWMPEQVREKWTTLSKPFGVVEYCPILWKTYVNSEFPTGGIPYLMSRRSIYYRYHSVDIIKRMRVSKGMTMLDNRFREAIHRWSEK